MKRGRFDKKGTLAIEAGAWGVEIEVSDPKPFSEENGVAIVEICGPLTQHKGFIFDSYDAIKERVAAALDSSCHTVLLDIDSPGGDVAGMADTAREIRAMARAKQKKIVAFTSGAMASGAYALGCAADEIAVTSSGHVGSIGVVAYMVDATDLDRMLGTKWAVITSGARKADGNPHLAMSEEAIASLQAKVDQLAEEFFALVAEARPLKVAAIRALEANTFIGTAATARGLADVVTTKSELLSRLAGGEESDRPRAATQEKTPMGWKDAMKKAAEEGDEEAKKALAALDDEDKPSDDDKKSEEEEAKAKKAEEEEAKKAEEEEAKKAEDEKKKEEAKASANVLERLGKVERENQELRARNEASDRAAILSARSDLTEGQKQYLASLSLEAMKAALKAFSPPPPDPAAVAKTQPTRGEGRTGERSPKLPPAEAAALRERMGLAPQKVAIRSEGAQRVFPAMTRDEVVAVQPTREGGA